MDIEQRREATPADWISTCEICGFGHLPPGWLFCVPCARIRGAATTGEILEPGRPPQRLGLMTPWFKA